MRLRLDAQKSMQVAGLFVPAELGTGRQLSTDQPFQHSSPSVGSQDAQSFYF